MESKQYCRGGFSSILTDKGNADLIEDLSQYLHADKNEVGKFVQRMVVYTHGIASLIAVGVLQGTKEVEGEYPHGKIISFLEIQGE